MSVKKVFLIAGILIIIVGIFIGIVFLKNKKPAPSSVQTNCFNKEIILWSPFDRGVFRKVRDSVQKKYCIKLKIVKKNMSDIEQELASSAASGEGPAIVYISGEYLLKHKDFFAPQPQKDNTQKLLFSAYPDSIKQALGKEFLAYPISYDALVVFWNKELLQSKGFSAPPGTLQELKEAIPALKKVDAQGNIELSPIALGTAENIFHNQEIFLAYWKMLNPTVRLNNSSDVGKSFIATLDALTVFANPGLETFSWHPNMPLSREAFLQEKTAMVIDMYSFKDVIEKRNARFSYGIASLPKNSESAKQANYFDGRFFGVLSSHEKEGWLVLQTLDEQYDDFIKSIKQPPVKIEAGKNLSGDEEMLFRELIISDAFASINKDMLRSELDSDFANWIANRKDTESLIRYKQVPKFIIR